jgi:hypothetical protein
MAWKVSWDTLRDDGTLPLLAPRTTRSGLNRLFDIDGTLTVFTALVAVFALPDFPSSSHYWLSPINIRLAGGRMDEDAGVGDKDQTEVKSQCQIPLDALTDWKVMYITLKYVILCIPREHV